jgi:hypothetical protein
MSLLLRAAVLGGIAYLITRAMRDDSMVRRSLSRDGGGLREDLHPDEANVWPTSESRQRTAAADVGPTS